MRLHRKRLILCGCGLALAIIVSGSWICCEVVSTALESEHNLHYSVFALRLVERFVTQNGRWPRSWAELEGVVMDDGPLGRSWPAASAETQRRITIDFEVDPLEVARQERMNFIAIRPKGPYFEYRDYGEVDALQRAILKSGSAKGSVK